MPDCTCLVIVTRDGKADSARNVQRDFRKVMNTAGLPGKEWTPRELCWSSPNVALCRPESAFVGSPFGSPKSR